MTSQFALVQMILCFHLKNNMLLCIYLRGIFETKVDRVAQSVWRLSYGLDDPGSNQSALSRGTVRLCSAHS